MASSKSTGIAVIAIVGLFLILGLIMAPVALGLAIFSNSNGGPAACEPTETGGSNPIAGAGGKYLIGDSLGVGMQDDLKGYALNVRGGRNLKQGLSEIEADKEKIAKSGSVVVELGTNDESTSDFKADAEKMVKKIRSFNPDAQFYWVQVFA